MPSAIDIAYTLHVRGDLDAAEAAYRRMIAEGEAPLDAANNFFLLLESQGRWDDLAELYRLVERWVPQRAEWAMTLAARLLEKGRFRAGWQWHEARRWQANTQSPSPPLAFPEWKGEPVERLLVWTEQGRGDEIMFARFLPLLAARGIDATFVCRPDLARAYRHLPVRLAPGVAGAKIPAQDRWVLLGTLPLLLAADLVAPPEPAAIKGDAKAFSAARIGVMTAGAPKLYNGVDRSLPSELAEQLLALPGAMSLAPQHTGVRDFQDTADLIAGLDLVISVDTSVAHLAGSMGKPTWVLLSAERSDWRWPGAGDTTPWYPSARLFRQSAAGDWRTVVAELHAALARRPIGAPGREPQGPSLSIAPPPPAPAPAPALAEQTRRYHEGLHLLADGRYGEGWPLYELRRIVPQRVQTPPEIWPDLACAEWRGENLRGRRLLVFLEQGFGDQIMFARFIPALEALGAEVVHVCAGPLQRLFPNAHVARRRNDFPPADYWVMLGSLPLRLGVTLDSLPPPFPLATAPLERGGGVGVVARGRPTHAYDQDRSLRGADAARLLALGRDLHPDATGAQDFRETADLIARLDLVITVDTAVAHLAGSMGKPTWVLVSSRNADWRWLRDRPDSPWYPSVRLYRQTQPGNWAPVLQRITEDLAARTG